MGKFLSEHIFQARNLGDIICDNTGILEMRNNVFSQKSGTFKCVNNTKLDLQLYLPEPAAASLPEPGAALIIRNTRGRG